MQRIVQTLSSAPCGLLCRLDGSIARSLLQKRGVSKVRRLDTKLLWLQRAANEKLVAVGPISTYLNREHRNQSSEFGEVWFLDGAAGVQMLRYFSA